MCIRDRVAGVVNFILDDEFVGMKTSFYTGLYQHKNDNSSLRDLVASYDYALAPKDVTTGETEKVSVAFGGEINGGKGNVVAVGAGTKENPISVKVGETVLYGKYSGTELKYEGKDYLIMKESDILAIV